MTQGFHISGDVMHVDNIALPDLAREYGTPAYVYSASVIRRQYDALNDALQKALPADRQPKMWYAGKANSNIAVLALLRRLGSGIEIVSEGELARALKAGFTGDQIISTSFGKTAGEFRACLAAGMYQINVDSEPELVLLNEIAAEMGVVAPVVFRLNPNVKGGGHHKISTGRSRDKFGLSAEHIVRAYDMAAKMENVQPFGVSMHIGSQVCTVESFKPAFEVMAQLVETLRGNGHAVERLDIGGGFPIVYKDEELLDLDSYAGWVRDIVLPLDTEIQMEPGRYLTGNCGVLLTEAVYVKETSEKSFLVLDAGMNDLIRPTLYEAYHGIRPVANFERPVQSYDVVGPVCETGDTFTEDREMPQVMPNEHVAIETTGAYGFAMASNYNSRPLPPEILVDGDKVSVIRPRQTLEEMMAGEVIPDWI